MSPNITDSWCSGLNLRASPNGNGTTWPRELEPRDWTCGPWHMRMTPHIPDNWNPKAGPVARPQCKWHRLSKTDGAPGLDLRPDTNANDTPTCAHRRILLIVWCVLLFLSFNPYRSVAGVGIGMLRGGGDSLTCKYKNYQISISYLLIDLKFISKIFKIFLRGSSSFSGARLNKTW